MALHWQEPGWGILITGLWIKQSPVWDLAGFSPRSQQGPLGPCCISLMSPVAWFPFQASQGTFTQLGP